MSGDGVAGGAFMAGFTVVNYGNIVYARPDYVENPLLPARSPTAGWPSPTRCSRPRATRSPLPPTRATIPTAGSTARSSISPAISNGVRLQRRRQVRAVGTLRGVAAHYASQYSRAARSSSSRSPGIPQRNPVTGLVTQASFVLQAPAGNNSGVTNGSASVPFNTTLVFQAGATLKSQNAAALRAEPGECASGTGHRD